MTISLDHSVTPDNMRIYAIGDVHGYLALLESIHRKIRIDLDNNPIEQYKIVFLGDYIDRGPDSAGCVQFLLDLVAEDSDVICLKGNHEDKLEKYLATPLDVAESFFTYGGVECAMSYGVDMSGYKNTDEHNISICNQLLKNIPLEHRRFYSGLEKSVAFGDYYFTHAGVRPNVPLTEQSDDDLMWIRSEFISNDALYEKVIVHGHTPAYPMEIMPNRINADTCAYDTGVLSCIVLEGTSHRVMEA